MVGTEGTVPVGEVRPEERDVTGERAGGEVGGEGEEEEMGFVRVLGKEGALEERRVEERF